MNIPPPPIIDLPAPLAWILTFPHWHVLRTGSCVQQKMTIVP